MGFHQSPVYDRNRLIDLSRSRKVYNWTLSLIHVDLVSLPCVLGVSTTGGDARSELHVATKSSIVAIVTTSSL